MSYRIIKIVTSADMASKGGGKGAGQLGAGMGGGFEGGNTSLIVTSITKKNGKGKGKSKGKKGGSASATPSVRDCANCGAPEGSIPGIKKHSACSKCQITFYCSTKCQKQHWKVGGHKQHCVAVADRCVTGDASAGDGSSGGAAAAEEEDECAICLEPLSHSPSQTLPCTHVYH